MKNFLKKYFPLIAINLISFFVICFPFWKGNTLKTLDLPGHVFATTFMREYIFPDINGWNPFQNLGYPEGSHYPPLIQYITSGISKITSLDIVTIYKLLIILTILVLPWIIFFFLKKVSREKLSNIALNAITIIVFLMFILLPSTFGGTLKAMLSTGLLNNFLTIPLFYLFVAYLYDFWHMKATRSSILKLSLLLSILILSHLVAGFVGAVIGGVVILVKVIRNKEYKALLIPLISLILTGFFVIPYVITLRLLTASKPILSDLTYSLAILLLTLITIGIIYLKRKQKSDILLPIFAFLLVLLPLFEAVTYRISGLTNFQLINAYRILPYAFYLGVPIFLVTIARFVNIQKRAEILVIGILLILSSVVIYKSNLQLRDIGTIDYSDVITSTLSSNYIDLYSRYDIWDNLRVPYMNLNDIKNNNFSIIGQFEESSYLNHFALSLKNSIDTTIKKTPVSKIIYIEDMTLNPSKFNFMKDLFNLGYGLILNENDKSVCKSVTPLQTINTRYNDLGKFGMKDDTISLCELPNSTNSDVNIYTDSGLFRNVSKSDWDKEVINWWTDSKNEILVEGESINISGVGKKIDTSIRLNWASNYQSFDFTIPTTDNSWALVKEQYNPRWKAFNENNEELKVYRVSPSMMLINSKGKITFKYEFNDWETLLKLVSLISFVSITGYLVIKKIKNRKK